MRAGQHNVPPIAGGPLVPGDVVVIGRHQALSRLGVDHGLVDRVEPEQRIAREVHLGDHPLRELGAEHREVDVGGAPGVVVVLPWVGPGLDRAEGVPAVVVGEGAAGPGEVRVDRRRVLVALVDVATGGIGLPDLDELVAHRASVTVEHPARDHDAFPDRFTVVLDRQVGLERSDVAVTEDRGEQLDRLRIRLVQVLAGMAEQAAPVGRVVEARLGLVRTGALVVVADPCNLVADLRLGGRGRVGVRRLQGLLVLVHRATV